MQTVFLVATSLTLSLGLLAYTLRHAGQRRLIGLPPWILPTGGSKSVMSGGKRGANRPRPILNISSPVDLAVMLVYAVARCQDDLIQNYRNDILELVQEEFGLSLSDAEELWLTVEYWLRYEDNIVNSMGDVCTRAKKNISDAQLNAILYVMFKVSRLSDGPTPEQMDLIRAFKRTMTMAR